jgi:hypothetical protein
MKGRHLTFPGAMLKQVVQPSKVWFPFILNDAAFQHTHKSFIQHL